ncbi:hypothetical protein GCM10011369_19060 [Neiella marina]|uniref:IrrE N-terminal-like domain-containing protein n=1 Tax=Neiella marina TaxID=508461 RepID=A0A8J2XP58_9GAMM|nr:ImmA/IrrE family metallo-endopeptidase [Neiella marina]GGA77370.1 hypothetical protein GCM10011369_19060 [Neiella marina]
MMNAKIKSEIYGLYHELGITSPSEIDLEAIAYYKNARVQYKPLKGCEARIIGVDGRAIITVNDSASLERQLFSIGHELGHWFKDRGKVGSLCSKSDMEEGKCSLNHREKTANSFASELLMPHFLFSPVAKDIDLTIDGIQYVKSMFSASFMATIRRTIRLGHHVGFLACYGSDGVRKYFECTPELPYNFIPPQHMPVGSAIQTLISNKTKVAPSFVDGEVWSRADISFGGVVREHAFHYHGDDFLTLVWWEDEAPIVEWIEREHTEA